MSAFLIAKGKDQGFLLSDEIIAAFPNVEADVAGLDEFYSSLLEYGIEVVDRVRHLTRTLRRPPLFPIEVRVSAADDIALSTCYGRESGLVAVHQYRGAPYEDYFHGVEAIMDEFEGRPHWGKLNFLEPDIWRSSFPLLEQFVAIRRQLDPKGVFLNDWLRPILE